MPTANSLTSIDPLIRRLERFGPLPEADKLALHSIGLDARLVEGRIDLVQEGEAPRGVFAVMDGFACRYKTSEKGLRQVMAYLLPGDFCDVDVALLSRMDHSIGTLSECRVVRIAPETLADLLHRPALARAMRMATLVEMANAREWIVNVGRRGALERTAHLICEMHTRLDVVGLIEEGGFHLPLTQADLADTTGMSQVHMNRSIKELKAAGLIDLRGRRLTVLDLQGLRRRCGFSPLYLHLHDLAA